MRSKVEPMKAVSAPVRKHLEGIAARALTRQTAGFAKAPNDLFQDAKRRAGGFTRLSTIRTALSPIAGTRDFGGFNRHASEVT